LQKEITDFFNKISKVYNSNLPFVVFRRPNEVSIKAYIQKNKELYHLNSFNKHGFVFAPFNKNEKIVVFPIDKCGILTSNTSDEYTIETTENKLNFKAVFNEKTKEDYVQLVQKGINFIKNKNAEKVVLSRKESLECDNLDVVNTLKKILNNYKNAFVYLWFHPSIGLWMGATPEKLINVNQSIFKTMALAGTQLYKNSKDVIWNEKEKKEQQFITDFILENIKETIDNIRISDAYTVKAGNLLHIRTDISGNLKSPNLLGSLIDTLHPTPAVLGLPKNMATKFILENEGYNRSYYSGYLGELNIDRNTNLFVNLRCMQLNKNTASIYIGGGITVDSNSIKEWEETVSKAEVMKNVL
jgi:isochorismate synthase